MGLFLPFVVIKGLARSKIISYIYLIWQNLISSDSFSLNHGSTIWLFLWFNRTVQKRLRNWDYCILILPCIFFGSKITVYCLNFAERMYLFIVVFRMINCKSDLLYLYRKDHLAIFLFIKFTRSSEFDCFMIIHFRKIQFLTQQLLLSQIGVTSSWWMLQRKKLNSKQKHLARVIQTALTKFLKNNSEWNLFVNLQIIRILSWFTWDFKKTYFAEHSMMAAFIKKKNHCNPLCLTPS